MAQGITDGPLKDVALPDAGSRVPGAVVDWFPRASLVPRNGEMVYLSSSRTTDSDGYAYAMFIPRRECPTTAGVGEVVTENGEIDAVVRVQVTSAFAPHSPLGVISKRHDGITIQVSHHTGVTAQTAGSAPALEAAADETPSCAYEGSASSTHHYDGADSPTMDVTTTVTATGLRFEMTSAQDGHYYYELAQGTIKVEVSGSDTNPDLLCTWSGGSTLTAETPNTPDKSTFGSMQIVPASGYSIVAATADLTDPVQVDCSGHSGQSYRTFYSVASFIRVPQNIGPNDLEPISDLQTLSGTRDDAVGIFLDPSHYEWNLHSAGCGPSPEPICQ